MYPPTLIVTNWGPENTQSDNLSRSKAKTTLCVISPGIHGFIPFIGSIHRSQDCEYIFFHPR